jgi:hypothetical protein
MSNFNFQRFPTENNDRSFDEFEGDEAGSYAEEYKRESKSRKGRVTRVHPRHSKTKASNAVDTEANLHSQTIQPSSRKQSGTNHTLRVDDNLVSIMRELSDSIRKLSFSMHNLELAKGKK